MCVCIYMYVLRRWEPILILFYTLVWTDRQELERALKQPPQSPSQSLWLLLGAKAELLARIGRVFLQVGGWFNGEQNKTRRRHASVFLAGQPTYLSPLLNKNNRSAASRRPAASSHRPKRPRRSRLPRSPKMGRAVVVAARRVDGASSKGAWGWGRHRWV